MDKFAIITAVTPSTPSDPLSHIAPTLALINEAREAELSLTPIALTLGESKWGREIGVMFSPPDPLNLPAFTTDALAIASQYSQESILTHRGVLYTADSRLIPLSFTRYPLTPPHALTLRPTLISAGSNPLAYLNRLLSANPADGATLVFPCFSDFTDFPPYLLVGR